MLQRNLVHTSVTPGRRLVVLVGQRKALAIAVKGAGMEAVVEAAGLARAPGIGLSVTRCQ